MKTPDLKTICCEALDDLKAQNILVLDIREISGFADWFIIATASSSRNAKAISNKLIESIKSSSDQHLVGIEGQDDSEWILVDCGDVVVNIMQHDTREFYDLESLWGEKTLVSA
jgi:ribosome-associated protein